MTNKFVGPSVVHYCIVADRQSPLPNHNIINNQDGTILSTVNRIRNCVTLLLERTMLLYDKTARHFATALVVQNSVVILWYKIL